jgi:glycosyltransferase involved in cell wall biosynthesis
MHRKSNILEDMSDIKYSMIIPVRNEEEVIDEVITDVKKALDLLKSSYEMIVIDNVSTDKTVDIVKKHSDVRLIQHESDKGYGGSIKEGVTVAKSDNVIIIDGDGTYPAGDIPKLVSYIGQYDLVSGARVGKDVSISVIRRIGKFFHHRLINFLAGERISDMNSGLRVFKKDVFLRYYPLYPSGFSISTTFLLACLLNDHPVKFVDINYAPRRGSSKIKIFRDGLNFLLLILRSIMYFNPLKIFLPISLFFMIVGLLLVTHSLVFYADISDSSVLLIVASILIGLFGLLADVCSKILMHKEELVGSKNK